jgi:hypothetical protein
VLRSCRWLISPRSDFPFGFAVRFGRRFHPRFVFHTSGFTASRSSGSISFLLLGPIHFCCARSCSPVWLLLALAAGQSPVGFLFGRDLFCLDCGPGPVILCHGSRWRPQHSLARSGPAASPQFYRAPGLVVQRSQVFPAREPCIDCTRNLFPASGFCRAQPGIISGRLLVRCLLPMPGVQRNSSREAVAHRPGPAN